MTTVEENRVSLQIGGLVLEEILEYGYYLSCGPLCRATGAYPEIDVYVGVAAIRGIFRGFRQTTKKYKRRLIPLLLGRVVCSLFSLPRYLFLFFLYLTLTRPN